ncbi:unnamed protein product [Ambrosiozyma monospora]|uniref:Unnamed protein product n=1 Tax=Ambrosiozyma monospora TaxID=43982 RepID=A0ACB5T0V1_AMBMO|nr:unnamed protein product [Ambrosiozyma monospora]
MIYEYVQICQGLSGSYGQQVVLTFSLQHINLLKYYPQFKDVIQLCEPLTNFDITYEGKYPDADDDDDDDDGTTDSQDDPHEFTISSVCLREPIKTKSTSLLKYMDFLDNGIVNTLEIPVDLLEPNYDIFEGAIEALGKLAATAKNLKLKNVSHFRFTCFDIFFSEVTELNLITGMAISDYYENHLDELFRSLKKVRIEVNDDWTDSQLKLISKMNKKGAKVEVIFDVTALFFNRSQAKKLLKEKGIRCSIDMLKGPINLNNYHNYNELKLDYFRVNDMKTLKNISLFWPEQLEIFVNKLENFKKGIDSVKSLNLHVGDIISCSFSQYTILETIEIKCNSIDIESFNTIPNSVEMIYIEGGFSDRGRVTLPNNLQAISFDSRPQLNRFNFENCHKLESIEFNDGLLGIMTIDSFWTELPKSLKEIVFRIPLIKGFIFKHIDYFGMTVNEDIEELTIVFENKEGLLVCINSDNEDMELFDELKGESKFRSCTINNVSRKVLFYANECNIVIACRKEDKDQFLSVNEKGDPFKFIGEKHGLLIFESHKNIL